MTLQLNPRLDSVNVRQLREDEVDQADSIFRVAFGTFVGMPAPEQFMAGADLIRFRWNMDPGAFLAAEAGGEIVGTNFASNWGSFGFFGPLSVRPDCWDKGIAQRLLDATMPLFEASGIEHAALFTFPDSFKHIWLYQKYGFWPRYLTAVMTKQVGPTSSKVEYSELSATPTQERAPLLAGMREVTDSFFPGLDLTAEIEALLAQDAGDVVLVQDGNRLMAFGLAHFKPGSEAEANTLYVKFGAARSGPDGARWLNRLVKALEDLAAREGKQRLVAGASMERRQAYQTMLDEGFRAALLGLAMHRPDDRGYNRSDALVIDDLR